MMMLVCALDVKNEVIGRNEVRFFTCCFSVLNSPANC